jgi:hypothetical protein
MSQARLAVTFLALFSFTVQSYLTQTHIHIPPALAHLGVVGGVAGKAPASKASNIPKDKYPASEDPANCPLCQEIMHAGLYVVPAAAALVLPTVAAVVAVPFIETVTHFRAPSHIWQGRAPPVI